MIELYSGDGKGKTTAAIGLSIRASAYGIPVVFAQFLKDDSSGEISVLRELDYITVMHSDKFYGFVKNMTDEQKKLVYESYSIMLDKIEILIKQEIDNNKDSDGIKMVVVLDEVLHALSNCMLDEDRLIDFLTRYRNKVEFVLTGRNPSDKIVEISDYYTEFKNKRHAYENGVFARRGIEF